MSKNGPIIIVEDDKDERTLYQHALNNIQIKNECYFFTNGEEALEYLKTTNKKPFLIISDMNMPKMNGLELRQKIASDASLKKTATPFVFRAGSANQTEINKTYELSAQGFFDKSHDFNTLEKHLKLIIDYWSECIEPTAE